MQPIAFCSRCRGMNVGLNSRYAVHCLICREWVWKSFKSTVLMGVVWLLIVAFPISTGIGYASQNRMTEAPSAVKSSFVPAANKPVAVRSIEALLAKYGVDRNMRDRVATAIVSSGLKYDLDSRLIASVMIVESRANPFAISGSDAIGVMQIHLPTWGNTAVEQGINLFKVEDNVDFGVRILKGYVSRFGLWNGVAHYTGIGSSEDSQQGAMAYVRKVQKVYGVASDTEAKSASSPATE